MNLYSAHTDQVESQYKLDYWNEVVCRNLIRLSRNAMPSSQFSCSIEGFSDGDNCASFISVSEFQKVKRTSTQVDAVDPHAYIFNYVCSGSMVVSQGSNSGELRSGNFSLCDARYPYAITIPNDVKVACFRLSADSLRISTNTLKRLVSVPFGSEKGMGLFVKNMVASLISQRKSVPPEDVGTLFDSFSSSLDRIYSAESGKRCLQLSGSYHEENIYLLSKRIIDRKFCDHSFRIGDIARQLGISQRHLHHIWSKKTNTPAQYLSELRVKRASELLRRVDWQKESITNIAFASGFSSLCSFNRIFKDTFSATPTEYRKMQ